MVNPLWRKSFNIAHLATTREWSRPAHRATRLPNGAVYFVGVMAMVCVCDAAATEVRPRLIVSA